jgi:hypothetical protein
MLTDLIVEEPGQGFSVIAIIHPLSRQLGRRNELNPCRYAPLAEVIPSEWRRPKDMSDDELKDMFVIVDGSIEPIFPEYVEEYDRLIDFVRKEYGRGLNDGKLACSGRWGRAW